MIYNLDQISDHELLNKSTLIHFQQAFCCLYVFKSQSALKEYTYKQINPQGPTLKTPPQTQSREIYLKLRWKAVSWLETVRHVLYQRESKWSGLLKIYHPAGFLAPPAFPAADQLCSVRQNTETPESAAKGIGSAGNQAGW